MPIILHNICKAYGEHTVFSDFTHIFNKGITLLTGNSGCGKTTLMRMIAGLEKPDSGTIQAEGKLSFMFQESRLFDWYTSEKNIALVSNKKKAAELLHELEMSDAANMYPEELSGGMQRRVALGRTLAYDADIYLFDEPTNGLEHRLKIRTAELIQKYTRGKIAIIVSHETEFLEPIVDFKLSLT